MPRKKDKDIFCSFCARTRDDAPQMISSPTGVYICMDCVDICKRLLTGDDEVPSSGEMSLDIGELPDPMHIKKTLDNYVIGQEKGVPASGDS